MITFFVISLLTNIVGRLVPDIIDSFHVSLTEAAFFAFSFFIAHSLAWKPSTGKDSYFLASAAADRVFSAIHASCSWAAETCTCSTPRAILSLRRSWTAATEGSLVYLKTVGGLPFTAAMKRVTRLSSAARTDRRVDFISWFNHLYGAIDCSRRNELCSFAMPIRGSKYSLLHSGAAHRTTRRPLKNRCWRLRLPFVPPRTGSPDCLAAGLALWNGATAGRTR
jgi:hypothetical protein